jgi:hypothetical protein
VIPSPKTLTGSPSPDNSDLRLRRAYDLLQDAFRRAAELQIDVWQFAVELAELCGAGVTHTDLRWLVARGYAQSGSERLDVAAPLRLFRRATSLSFPDNTCFILTAKGAEARGTGLNAEGTRPTGSPEVPSGCSLPQWDRERRRLLWRGRVVKEFRVPAPNQELILSAFEEEQWPPRIDDPLPLCPEMDAKDRLHEAIKSLNRRRLCKGLRFRGDGSGRGILWVSAGAR